jgi:hypothetical protein
VSNGHLNITVSKKSKRMLHLVTPFFASLIGLFRNDFAGFDVMFLCKPNDIPQDGC